MTKPHASSSHIPALDGVRGLAILIVFLYHYGGGAQSSNLVLRVLGTCDHAGWCGVTLFFLLSGFLISGILWDGKAKPGWWGRFYWRRTLRIFPLYYAALLLVLFAAALVGKGRDVLTHLWVYALYLQNMPQFSIRAVEAGSPLQLSHFWSLAVEEQFYLLWPFLLVRTKTLPRARMLCLAVFALSALFRFTIWRAVPTPLDYAGSLPARAGELALGAWLALCFRDPVLWRRVQKLAPAALAAGGIGFVSAAAVERSFNVYTPGMFLFGLPCISLALVAILTLSLGQGAVAAAVSVGWLRWLGGISYGVYVYHVLLTPVFHWVVVTIAPHADRNQTLGLTFAVAGFLTLAVAQISFVLFERPLLRLKNRVRPEHLEAANRPATLHG